MKYLPLLLALLIVGCSNSTDTDEPESIYPLKIETWTLQDSTNGRWDGLGGMGKMADSVMVTDTAFHKISIEHLEGTHQFFIHFTDSTLNKNLIAVDLDSINVTFPNPVINEIGQEWLGEVYVNRITGGEDYVYYRLSIIVRKCFEEDFPATEEIIIDIEDGNDEIVRHYLFPVQGIVESIKHMLC